MAASGGRRAVSEFGVNSGAGEFTNSIVGPASCSVGWGDSNARFMPSRRRRRNDRYSSATPSRNKSSDGGSPPRRLASRAARYSSARDSSPSETDNFQVTSSGERGSVMRGPPCGGYGGRDSFPPRPESLRRNDK